MRVLLAVRSANRSIWASLPWSPSLAKKLLSDIPRFLIAQARILFAVSLITLQTGIFTGFTRSTVELIDSATADIWVASQELVQLELIPILVACALDLIFETPSIWGLYSLVSVHLLLNLV